MRSFLAPAILLLQIAGCTNSGRSLTTPTREPDQAQLPGLAGKVASGGFVVFFRHAARDTAALGGVTLAATDNAGECLPGAELTPEGIADSEKIGIAFRQHHIPVAAVYASPTCRTRQMATLTFGRFEVTRALVWPGMWTAEERDTLTPMLRDLLGTPPTSGNVVLISHNDVLQADRVGVDITLDQAEAAIFRPLGNGSFEFVGKVAKEQWAGPPIVALLARPEGPFIRP